MAAVDMAVVATATFRLLYAVIVLGHDRRKIIHFNFTAHPIQRWLARQILETFPWDTCACRKLNPHILMVQPSQDWHWQYPADGLYSAAYRRILVQ